MAYSSTDQYTSSTVGKLPTMLETIDEQRALDLLAKAVTERGEDYVYERVNRDALHAGQCLYGEHGQPSCMVGMALYLHGLPGRALDHLAGAAADLYHDLDFLTPEASQVFERAQQHQDNGKSWGEAYEVAARYRNERQRVQNALTQANDDCAYL